MFSGGGEYPWSLREKVTWFSLARNYRALWETRQSRFGSFTGQFSCPRSFRVFWETQSDYEYEYEFFNVYPVRMPDCVRLSRQLVLSSNSRRRLDTNYEIFNKSRPPTTSSLQVQRRAKSLVFKGADTLWNDPCKLSRNVLTTLWHLVLFVY